MVHYREMLPVAADPVAVFNLLANLAAWPSLLPHVRSLEHVNTGRSAITFVWRWIPFTVDVAVRKDEPLRKLEQRFGNNSGLRVACIWAVDEGPDNTAIIRLEARLVQAPLCTRTLIQKAILPDLSRATLAMVQLLAESDRLAHTRIA